MADLTITPAQVLPGSDAIFSEGVAGAAITPGQSVYQDGSDANKWKLADADSTILTAAARGIAVGQAAADGQRITVQTGGTITLGAGAAPTLGIIYVVSGTAGGIAPSPAGSGDWTTILGVAGATNTLKMSVFASGQQVA